MKDFEKKLGELEFNNIQVPEEMEDILKESLGKANRNKNNKNKVLKIAAIFLAVLLAFNFDIVSATFKKLIGFDEYFSYNSYIEELNEEGKIQALDNEIEFSDGSKIKLEGLLYDGLYINLFVTGERDLGSISIEGGQMATAEPEQRNDGAFMTVYKSIVGKNLDLAKIKIKRGNEIKNVEVKIQKDKILKPIEIDGENKNVVIDGICFRVNGISISPLGISLDYSLTSEDKEKVTAIKEGDGSTIGRSGIASDPWIVGKNIVIKNSLSSDKNIELEDGMRYLCNYYTEDMRINRVSDIEVGLNGLWMTDKLGFNTNEDIENTWINEGIYIDSVISEDNDIFEVEYWRKVKKEKNTSLSEYRLSPYEAIYGDSQSKVGSKDIFGDSYKEFSNEHVEFNKEQISNLFIGKNIAFNISEENRSFKFKVRGE